MTCEARPRARLAFFGSDCITLEPTSGSSTRTELLGAARRGESTASLPSDEAKPVPQRVSEFGGELVQRGGFESGSYAHTKGLSGALDV